MIWENNTRRRRDETKDETPSWGAHSWDPPHARVRPFLRDGRFPAGAHTASFTSTGAHHGRNLPHAEVLHGSQSGSFVGRRADGWLWNLGHGTKCRANGRAVAHNLGDRGPRYVVLSTFVLREFIKTIKPRIVAWKYGVQRRDEDKEERKKRQEAKINGFPRCASHATPFIGVECDVAKASN